jgi:tetratricopeptide (TPR) repeat protein
MKLIIRYLILSVLIIFSQAAVQKLSAQNLEETIKFADNQFKNNELTTALKTYQRALFFSDGSQTLYLFRQIAAISYLVNDYETAQKYWGLAYNLAENDSLKTELLFNKASCQILNKNYQYALIDLFSVTDTSVMVEKRTNFYLGTCYFGLEDFSKARTYFELCVALKNRKEVDDLFSRKNLLSPSPKTARILSMITPGLGQAYSHDLKSGLNSLLLTSGLIALGINISIRYSPVDAIFAILPWYQRYYTGGFGKAGEIASRKRQLKRNEVYNKILKMIAENSTQY